MTTIRLVRLPDDRAQLLALDRSFITDRLYRIVRTAWSFTLDDVAVHPPLRKDFPLEEELTERRLWEHGLVAEQGEGGTIVGFAAAKHERWNRRTVLWHLYVAPRHRGQGVGTALIEEVCAYARSMDARCVWLETPNVNYPAITFYRRVGFHLCGLDEALYDPASEVAGETALYFVRDLS